MRGRDRAGAVDAAGLRRTAPAGSSAHASGKPGNVLQTSALINEAYLRLVDEPQIHWQNRAHFFGIAARLMRRILVDEARKRNSAKRGGATIHVSLQDAMTVPSQPGRKCRLLS